MFMVTGINPWPPPLNDSSECNMNKLCIIGTSHSKITLKVSVNENFSTLLDFVFLGFLA